MTAWIARGAFSVQPGLVHSASERWMRNAPPSSHSNVARPRPADCPSTSGSNSQVPARRPSGESAIASAAACGDGVLGEDRVDLADGLRHALLLAHGEELLH